MTSKSVRLALSTVAIACAAPWVAHAEYRCDPPPTSIDRRACEAAAESPAALRQYIQRVQGIRNLQFDDYVNKESVLAWEAARARELEAVRKAKESPVASSAKPETR